MVSAGTIVTSDGPDIISTMMPEGGNLYSDSNSENPTSGKNPALKWSPGDVLYVSAAGGTVVPFTGAIATVGYIADVSPPVVQPVAISVSKDFTVSWTPGSIRTAQMTMTLSASDYHSPKMSGYSDGFITCTVTDSTGTMTVPEALLSNFGASDIGELNLARSSTNTTTAANAIITLSSSTNVGNGVNFSP